MNHIIRLQSDIDQDCAACDEWWRDATLEDKFKVWDAIQAKHNDPVMEVVSRFAQLAFSEAAVRNKWPHHQP